MIVWQHMIHLCICMGSKHYSKIFKEVHTYKACLDYTDEMLFGFDALKAIFFVFGRFK